MEAGRSRGATPPGWDARSIVVHAPEDDGGRIACANLIEADPPHRLVSGGGTVVALPPAIDAGFDTFIGSAFMERNLDEGTKFSLQIGGLAPLTEYTASFHETRCEIASGSAHYRINRDITDGRLSNRLSTVFTTDAAGLGSGEAVYPEHLARAEARSLIVHPDPLGPGWACINLE